MGEDWSRLSRIPWYSIDGSKSQDDRMTSDMAAIHTFDWI